MPSCPLPSRRRVVLSTDIAESSLTVDGVRVPVDAGQPVAAVRSTHRDDPAHHRVHLAGLGRPAPGGQAAPGRAAGSEPAGARRAPPPGGRDHPGGPRAWRWNWQPGGRPGDCDGLTPRHHTLQQGIELLARLGATDSDGRITAIGRQMLALRCTLRRMVVAAAPPTSPGVRIGALLDERDVFRATRADAWRCG